MFDNSKRSFHMRRSYHAKFTTPDPHVKNPGTRMIDQGNPNVLRIDRVEVIIGYIDTETRKFKGQVRLVPYLALDTYQVAK